MSSRTCWTGGLNFLKAEEDRVQEGICQVKVDANFDLPPVPFPTISGFIKELPENQLDLGGLCVCLRFIDRQKGSEEERNFVGLLQTLAGKKQPGDNGGEYVARNRQFVRLAIGRGPHKREFLGVGPRNPQLIDNTYVLRCYQATSHLKQLSAPPVVTRPSPRAAEGPSQSLTPFPVSASSPSYPYPQPYPYAFPGVPLQGGQQPVGISAAGHLWPGQHWPGPYPPGMPPSAWPPGQESLTFLKQEDSGASSSGMADQLNRGSAATSLTPGAIKTENQKIVHKSMLKTWAQHHPFLLGAVAELVDNSYDQGSTLVELKVTTDWKKPILTIKDNGNGMDAGGLRHMLKIGHKRDPFNKAKLGKYGVGFKQGSMRIGDNAIVITKRGPAVSVGLVSQAYNNSLAEDAGLELPVMFYKFPSLQFDLGQQTEEDARSVLEIIAKFTPFNEMKLGMEIARIGDHGTTIHIWDLTARKPTAGNPHPYEMQWVKNDIILSSKKKERRPGNFAKQMDIDWSLRAYMQLLYFGNRNHEFRIRIQDRMVESGTAFTAKSLQKQSRLYKKEFPIHFEEDVPGMEREMTEKAKLIFGYSKRHAEDNNCGVCIYWRGRLIKSFDTMDIMTQKDFGVIGLCSTGSILNVINNKQDFQTNLESWEAVEAWIKECFREYKETVLEVEVMQDMKNVEENIAKWAYCDSCGKARKIPEGMKVSDNDDSLWYCWDLPEDNPFRDCSVPQEAHDHDEVTISTKNAGVTYKGGASRSPAGSEPKLKKLKTRL